MIRKRYCDECGDWHRTTNNAVNYVCEKCLVKKEREAFERDLARAFPLSYLFRELKRWWKKR